MLLQLPGQLAQRLFPASEGVVPTSAWPVARVVAAEAFLKLLTNAYELVHDDSDALRSEISAATDTVTTVLVPLLRAAAATAPGGGPPPLLGLAIRALILCAFGAPRKVLRAAVATAPFEELLGFARGGAQPLKATGLYFAMLANVDALSALSDATAETAERARADSLVVAVQAAVEVLSVDDASSLHAAMNASGPRRLLADPGPRRLLASLPISRDSPTADDLGVILQQRLLVAQPDVSSELRDQLAGLEVKAAQLEALQEELVPAEQQQLVLRSTWWRWRWRSSTLRRRWPRARLSPRSSASGSASTYARKCRPSRRRRRRPTPPPSRRRHLRGGGGNGAARTDQGEQPLPTARRAAAGRRRAGGEPRAAAAPPTAGEEGGVGRRQAGGLVRRVQVRDHRVGDAAAGAHA